MGDTFNTELWTIVETDSANIRIIECYTNYSNISEVFKYSVQTHALNVITCAQQTKQWLILHSHKHSGTVQYNLERFGTITVCFMNRYRAVLDCTGLARFLLLCCTVQHGSHADSEFGCISKIALRYLCIPASSAPVERIFSIAGKVFRPERCRLKGKTLEQLMFIKCNLNCLK